MEENTVRRGKDGRFLKTGDPVEEKAARATGAKAPRKRRFRAKQMRQLLDQMLAQFAEQVEDANVSLSLNDAFKLFQLKESVDTEKPSSVKVEWVERKEK